MEAKLSWRHFDAKQERSLKEVMNEKPMTEAQAKCLAERRVSARRSIEDRALEKELNW